MTDDDSFSGRVGGAMGRLGARLAGERYLGLPVDRERHAADIKSQHHRGPQPVRSYEKP